MFTADRNTGRMDLCKTWITEKGAFFMCFPDSSHIAAHGVGGEIEYVPITAAAQQHSMAEMSFQFAGYQVSCYDTPRLPIDHHDLQHFMAGVLFNITQRHLSFQCLISANEQLLPGLTCGIKCS